MPAGSRSARKPSRSKKPASDSTMNSTAKPSSPVVAPPEGQQSADESINLRNLIGDFLVRNPADGLEKLDELGLIARLSVGMSPVIRDLYALTGKASILEDDEATVGDWKHVETLLEQATISVNELFATAASKPDKRAAQEWGGWANGIRKAMALIQDAVSRYGGEVVLQRRIITTNLSNRLRDLTPEFPVYEPHSPGDRMAHGRLEQQALEAVDWIKLHIGAVVPHELLDALSARLNRLWRCKDDVSAPTALPGLVRNGLDALGQILGWADDKCSPADRELPSALANDPELVATLRQALALIAGTGEGPLVVAPVAEPTMTDKRSEFSYNEMKKGTSDKKIVAQFEVNGWARILVTSMRREVKAWATANKKPWPLRHRSKRK